MINNFYAKTLLKMYRRLSTAVAIIDNKTDRLVKRSMYYDQRASTLELCNNIIELGSIKLDYINLKVLVDKATAIIPYSDKVLLKRRFIDEMPFKNIALLEGVSLRTVFRQFDGAITAFCCAVERIGFDDVKIQKSFAHLPLFISMYEKVVSNGEIPNKKNTEQKAP